jgi:hypothetical protein
MNTFDQLLEQASHNLSQVALAEMLFHAVMDGIVVDRNQTKRLYEAYYEGQRNRMRDKPRPQAEKARASQISKLLVFVRLAHLPLPPHERLALFRGCVDAGRQARGVFQGMVDAGRDILQKWESRP